MTNKTEILSVRIEPTLKKSWEDYCAKNNYNPSELIRQLVEEELRRQSLKNSPFKNINFEISALLSTKDVFKKIDDKNTLNIYATFKNMEELQMLRQLLLTSIKLQVSFHYKSRVIPESMQNQINKINEMIFETAKDLSATRQLLIELEKVGKKKDGN